MKRHKLKILRRYFEAKLAGIKPFEFRRDDRGFKVGDEIELVEIMSTGISEPIETGRTYVERITYILRSTDDSQFEGLEVGYAVLGTEPVDR